MMKRIEALAPLSREHHETLILVQLLKKGAPAYKGLPQNIGEKILFAQQQFKRSIRKHFLQEEMMLQKVSGCHEKINVLSLEIKKEHENLTSLLLNLDKNTEPEEDMHELALALEQHIRKEERMLFPLIQEYCTANLLSEIYALLH